MPQVKIYVTAAHLATPGARTALSDAIHACVVDALKMPESKKFQRFIPVDAENFIYPEPRTDRYTIVEVSMIEGRTPETKRALIRQLFARLTADCGLSVDDVEITLFETPLSHWGLRGTPADEQTLTYSTTV